MSLPLAGYQWVMKNHYDDSGLRYDVMVENALRGVVREALRSIAEHGLPGDHHFYISFQTDFPGVTIPDYLKQKYPDEMTIVLQYQFWGLDVGNDAFAVTLSFNDVQERVTVPFDAITSFADPAVQFGLQFQSTEEIPDDQIADLIEDLHLEDDKPGKVESMPSAKTDKKSVKGKSAAGDKNGDQSPAAGKDKIVDLASFRKKPKK